MESTRDFRAGIPEIDQQTTILLDCLSLIEEAVSKNTPRSAIQPILGQVVQFARQHSAHEERSMLNHQYPGLAKHTEEHCQIMSYLMDWQERSLWFDVSLQSIFFIENRLLEHTMSSDRQYGYWLAKGERG